MKTQNPNYREQVRAIFDKAPFIAGLGLVLSDLGPGWCETVLPVAPKRLQRDGHAHAGVQAFHQQLPANWALPEPAPIGHCPDISGRYVNSGESIKNKKSVPLIFELFTKGRDNPPLVRWQEVSHISIRKQGGNLLNVVAWKDNEELYSASLSKDSDDFTCEDGWLKIKASAGFAVGGGGTHSWISRNFTNSNGYLLEKREIESFTLILIIPYAESRVEWYRFARSEKSG